MNEYPVNVAADKLVKKVIHNMQWNKNKKVINVNDQTDNNNPTTQQK
ncbi:hypothetical protein ABPH35_06335 [Streptococcus sp. ZJ93]